MELSDLKEGKILSPEDLKGLIDTDEFLEFLIEENIGFKPIDAVEVHLYHELHNWESGAYPAISIEQNLFLLESVYGNGPEDRIQCQKVKVAGY